MVVPTASSSEGAAAPGSGGGRWAVVLGVLSAATMPIAIVGTRYSDSYDLVHAAFAIPLGVALGAGAIAVARSANRRASVRLDGGQQRGAARIGRALGIAGIAIAASALISVSVYGLLTYLGEK